MRTYYIFKINKLLNPIYEEKTTSIYKLLEKVNNLDKKEYALAMKIYSKLVIPIDKKKIDNYLIMNHINDLYYTKSSNIHTLYSDMEKSKLKIYNTYIKIITTNNISSFFKDIFNMDNSFFCVDFENKDYFYISSLYEKSLV